MRGTRTVRRAFDRIQVRLAGIARAAKIAAAGLGLVAVALSSAGVAAAANFQDAMVKSTAIMGDLTDAMQNNLTRAAREVALVTEFSAKQAAESYFFLASAGLDAAQSIEALPVVANFAQAGAFDMAQATDLLTDAQSALGLTIKNDVVKNMENMIRVSDVLVKANTLANATVQQFSEALTREAGAALKSFNIDIEEGVAVLAAFADQGVKAQFAGTSLSRILRLMTSAAVENEEAYEFLNIRVFDAVGNIRFLADIIADLEKSFGRMQDKSRVAALDMLGFQARVQGTILPLIGTSEAIRQYEEDLRKAGGTTKEIAKKQLQSFIKQMGLVKDALVDVLITIGNRLLPVLTDIGNSFKRFITENRREIDAFVTGFADMVEKIITAVRNIVPVMVDWVKENRVIITTFFTIIAVLGLASLAIAFLTNPIVLVATSVVGLMAIFNRWGGDMKEVLNRIARGFAIMVNFLDVSWQEFVAGVEARTERMTNILKAGFLAISGDFAGAFVVLSLNDDFENKMFAIEQAFKFMLRDTTKVILETDYIGAFAKNLDPAIDFAKGKIKELEDRLSSFLTAGGGDFQKRVAKLKADAEAAVAAEGSERLAKLPGSEPETEILAVIPTFNQQFLAALAMADSFNEKLSVIGTTIGHVFGTSAKAAFSGFAVAGSAAFVGIQKMSAAFFAGEAKNLLDFKALGAFVWASVASSALDAIATILKERASQWAIEAGAALVKGNFAQAAGLFAQATLAGGAAGIVSGAAQGIRQRAQRQFDENLSQRDAGTDITGGGSDGGDFGSRVTRGTVTQIPPRNLTINSTVSISGETVFVGSGSVEEFEESLGDLIARRIEEIERHGGA